MFEGIKNGAALISASFRIFLQFPVLSLPIFIAWFMYVSLSSMDT